MTNEAKLNEIARVLATLPFDTQAAILRLLVGALEVVLGRVLPDLRDEVAGRRS